MTCIDIRELKPITLKEAEEFDRAGYKASLNQDEIDKCVERINEIIRLNYDEIKSGSGHYILNRFYPGCKIWEEVERLYKESGFDLLWGHSCNSLTITVS